MQTTECPRCRHTFLSYASECPECGLKRPRDKRPIWESRIAVIASCLALAAAVLMANYVAHHNDDPVFRERPATKAALPKTAHTTAANR